MRKDSAMAGYIYICSSCGAVLETSSEEEALAEIAECEETF